MNLVQLLDDHPSSGDDVLIHGSTRRWTRTEFDEQVDRLATDLRNQGVHSGRAVAALADGADMVVAMFAIWRAGAIFVPLNPRLPERAVDEVIGSTGASAMIGPSGVETLGGATKFADGAAFVMWTSGTTGRPKAVLHSHEDYVELIDRVLGRLRTGASERSPSPNLIAVSMALNAGIYNALFGIRAGAPLVIMDRFDPGEFARLIARFEIRSTVLPPAAITMLTDDPEIVDLAPLRYLRSITAPLSPRLARRFAERFDVILLNGYGQAELGEVIGWSARQGREHPEKVGSVGTPHAGVSLRIADPDPEGIGELLVRPPGRAIGYTDGEDLADRLDADGYMRTGDLARIDDDGFVWIEGRVGDLVNRGGNKIYPEEVEAVLTSVPGVRDAAVIGEPDDRLGEVPVAYLVTDDSVDDTVLEAACRDALAPYKVPVRYERRPRLPRNEIGKLMRSHLTIEAGEQAT